MSSMKRVPSMLALVVSTMLPVLAPTGSHAAAIATSRSNIANNRGILPIGESDSRPRAREGAVARGAQTADPLVARASPLEVDLIVTDKGKELLNAWEEGSPQFTVRNVEAAKRGEFLTVIVRFLGCVPDAQGLCNATVDYVAKKPDGTVYGELKGGELWFKRPAPDPGFSQLSVQYLGLVIEPKDPSGKYTVSATVRDHNGHRTLPVSRTFLVP